MSQKNMTISYLGREDILAARYGTYSTTMEWRILPEERALLESALIIAFMG